MLTILPILNLVSKSIRIWCIFLSIPDPAADDRVRAFDLFSDLPPSSLSQSFPLNVPYMSCPLF